MANLNYRLFATIKYKCIASIPKIRKVHDKILFSSDFNYLPSLACRTLYCGSKVQITDKIARNGVYILRTKSVDFKKKFRQVWFSRKLQKKGGKNIYDR